MTPEQIKLIKLSFVPVVGRKREAGKLFYQRLFETAPALRSMFKSDMNAQAEKLMSMFGLLIASLQDAPSLMKILENLGRQHIAYGVRDEHYDQLLAALLWTLERMLGDAFTAEAREAWVELYNTAAGVMREVAHNAGSQAERTLRMASAGKS